MARRWYVVRVQSGREGTVQTALARRLKVAAKEAAVPRVLVPVETVTELKGGKKRTRKRKLYPGYVLVEVEEEQGKVPRDVWFLVRETAGAPLGTTHAGWSAAVDRAAVIEPVPGLELVGASVFPGPGIPYVGWGAAHAAARIGKA